MTLIQVPLRNVNRLIGQSAVIRTELSDWRQGPLVNRLETVTSSLMIGDRDCALSDWRQIEVSLSWGYQRGNLPHIIVRGTVSIHVEYLELERSASRMA